jgi:hypothetical protein
VTRIGADVPLWPSCGKFACLDSSKAACQAHSNRVQRVSTTLLGLAGKSHGALA